MSSTALRAGGILRALTDDHPQSLRDSPRQRGGGQKMAQSLRGSPPGPATTDVLRTTILLLACQLDFAYKQLRCLLNGSARQRGEARQQSPRDALNQIRPRVTKALAIPSSWMSVAVMSQKHSMP